jgi:hypothetical protein
MNQLSVVSSLSLAFTYHAPTITGSNPLNLQVYIGKRDLKTMRHLRDTARWRKKAQNNPRSAAFLREPCGAIFAQQNRASATLVPRENARRPWPCTFSMAYPFCGGPPPRGPPRLPRSAWPVQGGMLGPAPPVRTHCDLEFPFKGNADAESI